ncbi:MAG: FRG domain-containing protein [Lachnospiraceae bacterium]|nr:FRG domain-containing protein [Lachnospiraceae bacterium]
MEEKRKGTEVSAERLISFGQENTYINEAFYHVFGKRLLSEGYVDGSYILKAVTRSNYYSQLKASKLQGLFASKSCVPSENIDIMIGYLENIVGNEAELKELEEEALVFWIFLPYLAPSKREQRKEYLLQILERLLAIYTEEREWELVISEGVIFDKNVCALIPINSLEKYVGEIFSLKEEYEQETLLYRGQSWLNYFLRPGIKRERHWLEKEDIMYQEILVRCAQNFVHCQTHLDYLVEMQHYGLPTRLLDVTENPLVALYFACCTNQSRLGEVLVLHTKPEKVKYAKSDTVAFLAALPTLNHGEQTKLFRLCKNHIQEENDIEYKKLAGKLAAEVKSRNPAFEPRIRKADLLSNVFVTPLRNNQRIMKQEGSFIICGLGEEEEKGSGMENMRCQDKEGKKRVFVIKNKEKIVKELDMLSINRASLFPEIDDVAEYIREKYQ